MRQRCQLSWVVICLVCSGCQEKSAPPAQSKQQLPVATRSKEKEAAASEQLPNGWQQTGFVEVDPQQAAQIGQRLGGQISELKNVIYSIDGQRFQLNTIRCPDEADARRIAAALLTIHGGVHCRCVRQGESVYEFVCQDLRLVERAYRELKMAAATVTYEVTFQVAPLTRSDPMLWNNLFNACLAKDEGLLDKLLPSFTFGDRLNVRRFGQGTHESKNTFEPVGVSVARVGDGELEVHRFNDLPVNLGVPRVISQVQVSSTGFAVTRTKRHDTELVAETASWPKTDKHIVELSEQIVGSKTDPREQVQALLDWFADTGNLRFDGSVVGSRYGVTRVLEQRFGHCWDYSDCFITLARAASIPCRQVYGWLYGQSGHVWVEVLTTEGWRAVDPTAGMGCDSRYIPLFTSENGSVDFVYTSMPQIKIVQGR